MNFTIAFYLSIIAVITTAAIAHILDQRRKNSKEQK